jgi:hypothetical protein
VNLHPHDIVDCQGTAFTVAGVLAFALPGRTLRLARLVSGADVRFLDLPAPTASSDRILLLAQIPPLDIEAPAPATLYHAGESFLVQLSGVAEVTLTGEVPGCSPGPCPLWRYRAAGDRYLQIEAWPTGARMLEGATLHRSMIEVRPPST